ncbi:Tat pathway signal protein [Methylobacterium currus]|uniref:Tat pathway signal protein n=1 Tax=Methylobacterium currus TaxID=2051553 RepID=A0A2R4WHL1_9HYPH|nr:Tat pathway signal protein [Methylobacterium currus]AWB21017.1 Tat pathway signal protein [Methylobacterium currus]UHC14151.1 Tat pathway signal protein [Methylobacterium currus]
MLTQGLPRSQASFSRARIGRLAALLCLALSPLAATAQAAEGQATVTPAAVSQPAAPPLRVELNKLETAGEACKAMLIVENGKGGAIRSLRLDLYAFDPDGIVQKRSMVELGPVPARKTALRQFEISPTPCAQVGRVLLNDVASCEGKDISGQDLSREACLERIEPSSAKGAAPFVR